MIEALAAMGPAARPAVPALSKWLQDEKFSVFAAEALWHITGKVEPSLTVLIQELDNKNEETQQRAVQALIKLGPRASPAVPKLRQLLRAADAFQHGGMVQTHGRQTVYIDLPSVVPQALGEIGPGARPAIKDLLRLLSSENQYYRTAAAEALGEIGGEAEIPPLVVMVEVEGLTAVAEAGELALNKIRFRMKTDRR